MLQPLRRRTWAPRGHTPILYAWDRHDRWSALGAITVAPWALRLGLYFRLLARNVTADDVIDFLRHLHRQVRRKIIVVMDRWGVHRRAVRELQEQGATWLRVEWLPSYAPDLNPVEHVWNHTKWCSWPTSYRRTPNTYTKPFPILWKISRVTHKDCIPASVPPNSTCDRFL